MDNLKHNVAVIGLQWGDEGKGKIVDYLSQHYDVVARFQGGNNAGHTIVINEQTFALSILPSGILRDNVVAVIGNGVVLDPWKLLKEIKYLKESGISVDSSRLMINSNCHIITSSHRELDSIYDKVKNIGTTKMGIGPCYEDKVARRGIRLCDLLNVDSLKEKINALIKHHTLIKKGYGVDSYKTYEEILEELLNVKDELLPYIKDNITILSKIEDKKIMFEGAQGIMLDLDFGTYPFVTSSNTIVPQVITGTGINTSYKALGVIKSYTTRVGEGPFPTGQQNSLGDSLRIIGKEKGTVSSRDRRCGWLDIPLLRMTLKISKIDALILTKLDVLDSFDEIKICTSYSLNGTEYDIASSTIDCNKVEPNYITLPGWHNQAKTEKVTDFDLLPENAKSYIETIEKLLKIKVIIISTGSERKDTIFR
ncbi:adenylosuccinate synthase [Anaplasmataceae bacterium AB001_6]|nr:adenylosuccinate synthase [Anaplasmataceae bacterium AB001_6]